MAGPRLAVYAGSFDPVTYGHLDVARRACRLFDRVVLAIGENPKKRSLIPLATRLDVLREATADLPGVTVDVFSGLLVHYCERTGANAIVRGLRAVTDFEFEFQTGLANMDLSPGVETVFLLTEPRYIFISSSIVKEIASNGGDVSRYVPPAALDALRRALAGQTPDGGASKTP